MINIGFDCPDGTSYKHDIRIDAGEFSTPTDRCEVKIAYNCLQGDLERCEIHVRDECIEVTLDVSRTTESWRAPIHPLLGQALRYPSCRHICSEPGVGRCACTKVEVTGHSITARKRSNREHVPQSRSGHGARCKAGLRS